MDLCKKNICEGSTQVKGMGDDFPEEDGEPREHSGGCGSLQPSLKVEGMKVVAEFKPPSKKDQDEVQLPEAVERKQVWFGDKVGALAEPVLLVPVCFPFLSRGSFPVGARFWTALVWFGGKNKSSSYSSFFQRLSFQRLSFQTWLEGPALETLKPACLQMIVCPQSMQWFCLPETSASVQAPFELGACTRALSPCDFEPIFLVSASSWKELWASLSFFRCQVHANPPFHAERQLMWFPVQTLAEASAGFSQLTASPSI